MEDFRLRSDAVVMTRRQWLAFAGGAAATAMLPFGAATKAHAQKQGGVLKVAAPHNPTSMDPMTGRHGNDHILLFPVYEALVNVNLDTLMPEAGLAESWTYTDPTTLVLELRKDVTFHDGTPFNAGAAVFNLERARTDERSRVKIDLLSVESIQATGEHQVTIKLKEPDAVLLSVLSDRAGMMSSPKAVKEMGEGYDRTAVGTGPWRLTEWRDAERLVYTRNENYWQSGAPYLDGIEVSVITDSNTGLRSVVAGQNHFVMQLAPQQKPLIEASRLKAASGPTLATFHFYLNYSKPPFDKKNVRLALCHAVDRDALNELTMAGLGVPTVQTLPASHWAYNPELEGTYKHDPELAIKLLAEAGHPDGVDVEMFVPNTQAFQQKGEVLVEQLKKAKINLILRSVPTNELGAKFMGERLGNAALSIYSGRTDPSQFFSLMFDPESFINASRMWGAPELEQAMADCRSNLDLESRKQAIQHALKIINENALYVPLVLQVELNALAPAVEGYAPSILGKPRFETVHLAS
ncbi:ABC transporter substrate-binding protein [Mesorhizobium sp. 1B3]|uniref:ABC transporter substrate-binding protein n=1 Tax=Mesorhizobium sp. 1B3 TaxID=3243599 RepID=UPI003D97A1B1